MSAKQAINYKLQGSVATYVRYGGVVNNQINKGLLLYVSEKMFKIDEYLTKLEARAWLSHALCAPALLKDKECARDIHVLARNFTKYSPIKQNFSHRLSNKLFLFWLLTP